MAAGRERFHSALVAEATYLRFTPVQTQVSSLFFPASPSRCPTPCVLLAGVNTFIDLLFHMLLFVAVLSTGLLMAELRGIARR